MILADAKTSLERKLAIIVNTVTCDPCEYKDVAACKLKKELDEMDYLPIGRGSKRCKYCIS